MATTTTTPESRARLAYTAYGKSVGFTDNTGQRMPIFDDLDPERRAAWQASQQIIWDLATTGRASL